MVRTALTALCLAVAGAAPALAEACDTHSGLPVPRFVSLKFAEVNGRAGPSLGHPVRWVYVRRGLPVQVVAETADWRQVRDPEGETVWMHRRTLSGRRAVRALDETPLRARPEADAVEEAMAEPGAVLWLERCRLGWCRVEADDLRGWARAEALWGVYAHETSRAPAEASTPCTPETAAIASAEPGSAEDLR